MSSRGAAAARRGDLEALVEVGPRFDPMKSEHLPSRSHTRELLDFLAVLSLGRVPGGTIASAKSCLLDTLGCMLFGAPEPWSKIMADEMLAERSYGVSTIAGHSARVSAPAAALCNATAAHGFELDDHLDEAIVHPGAIVASA